MSGYNSQSQSLTNSIAATVDATNGLLFSNGDTQTINGVKVTDQRALGDPDVVQGDIHEQPEGARNCEDWSCQYTCVS